MATSSSSNSHRDRFLKTPAGFLQEVQPYKLLPPFWMLAMSTGAEMRHRACEHPPHGKHCAGEKSPLHRGQASKFSKNWVLFSHEEKLFELQN